MRGGGHFVRMKKQIIVLVILTTLGFSVAHACAPGNTTTKPAGDSCAITIDGETCYIACSGGKCGWTSDSKGNVTGVDCKK